MPCANAMHIAYIHQHFSTKQGATGTRSYEMSRRLIDAGHRVTMICGNYTVGHQANRSSGPVSEYEVDGISVKQIAVRYANEMSFTQRIVSFFRFARGATKIVSKLNADIVFATSTPLTVGIPGMKGAKKSGAAFVFEVRDLWPELPIALGVLKNPVLIWYTRRLERKIYRAAIHIIALAPGIKEGICNAGIPESLVSIIPNSSDLDLFQPTDAKPQDPRYGSPDDFRLVFTGAHGLANGLDAAIDAAAEIKRRQLSGIRFIFIGQGNQKKRLMARSREEKLDDYISWIDSMPKQELAKLLPQMDVGLMMLSNIPSFYYGTSPNKFFDYLACGLPVLNNYPGWLADMIGEHDCGIAVNPDDPNAFVDAIVHLREDKQRLVQMGHNARKLAQDKFSRDHLAGQLVSILEEVHSAHHQAQPNSLRTTH